MPNVVDIEFLSENKTGVGARFRETRNMNGKETITELQVTEYVKNEHVRIISDTQGTVWDSVFHVNSVDDATELNLTMEAKPHKFLPRLSMPLFKGMMKSALEKDMDAVKAFCEQEQSSLS